MSASVGIHSVSTAPSPSGIIGRTSLIAFFAPGGARVNWGSTGPDGTLPLRQDFLPNFFNEVLMPDGERPYADGAYTVHVRALNGTDFNPTRLYFFLDNNGTAAQERTGSNGVDLMMGGSGNDTFMGRGGADVLFGGAGRDLLNGGDGDDTLVGGDGNDTLLGGEGDDSIDGGPGADLIRGGQGDDTLLGAEGNDTLFGDGGHDIMYGGFGDDVLNGGDGDDLLIGETGDDVLRAGSGQDTLVGGLGRDRLFGDEGLDVTEFVYDSPEEGRDVIFHFVSGVDIIRINFLLMTEMDDFRLVGSRAQITDEGRWLVFDAATSNLFVDMNGTAPGEYFHIARLAGVSTLAMSDFRFVEYFN